MLGDDRLDEAGRAQVGRTLKKARKRTKAACDGDADAVHDMRVALRRSREGLAILGETVAGEEAGALRRGLRRLTRALGAVRDADVLLHDLGERPDGGGAGLAPLRARVERRRARARERLARVLDARRARRALARVRRFVKAEPAAEPGRGGGGEVAPALVRHFAASAVWRRYEAVLAYDAAGSLDVEALHRLRAACKRLRYAIDFFDGALGEPADALTEPLRAAQDHLGELHDHQVAVCLADRALRDDDTPALRAYRDGRARARDRLREAFAPRWAEIAGDAYRRRLALACALLGYLHESGQGVPKDGARARALYEKSCGAQNEQGCEALRRIEAPNRALLTPGRF